MIRKWLMKWSRNIKVYRYTNIYKTAIIGRDSVIGSYTEIGDEVKIGERCKIQAMVFIPKGVTIGNDVFIGPRVCFVNDLYPKANGEWKVHKTTVGNGASVGAGSVIICGVDIGCNAKIGAGSVVTRNVPPDTVVYGVPAKQKESRWK